MVVNFLHVNNRNYFIMVCFKKACEEFCLFVYYIDLISIELWMVEEGATLNGNLEIWMVEGKIRRGIRKQCRQVFFIS